MAGIFLTEGFWSCGFDFLTDGNLPAGGVFDLASGTSQVGAAYARFAGKGLQVSNGQYNTRSYGVNLPTIIGGLGFLTDALPSGSNTTAIVAFYDSVGAGTQGCVGFDTTGALSWYSAGGFYSGGGLGNPSTPLCTSAAGLVLAHAYNFLEFLVTIHPSSGSIILRLNGSVIASFAGNTRKTANSWSNQITYGNTQSSGLHYSIDDLYLLDTTGPAPLNTFLGNGRIQTDGPTADSLTGGLNQWAFTTPQGSDYANAANIPASLTQYDSDGTLNDRMSFRFPVLTFAKILFLNTWLSAEQDAAGTRAITPIYRSNAVDQVGTAVSLSNGTYVYSRQGSSLDPNTGLPWASGSVTAAESCEIGVKVTT